MSSRNKFANSRGGPINRTGDRKNSTNRKFYLQPRRNVSAELVDVVTLRPSAVDEDDFWSGKISLKGIARLYLRSGDLSPISPLFSQVAASLFGQAAPVNQPESHYRPVSISCYRRIPSRRQPSPVYSPVGPFCPLPRGPFVPSATRPHYQRKIS